MNNHSETKEFTLTDMLIDRNNLNRAYKKVKANKGTCGVDGMNTDELFSYLRRNRDSIIDKLKNATYMPSRLKTVYIPKDNGEDLRKLSIPTLADRVILQALAQVISPVFEHVFSESSHGFRPERGIATAVTQCRKHIEKGHNYAVHIDLEKFFDNINHRLLMEYISDRIHDDNVLKLIKAFISISDSSYGLSQGSPLSPLLSNIYLNNLDSELSANNIPFVRYADDCILFFKDIHSAVDGIKRIATFIENTLDLKINYSKTRISHISKASFLGYSFYKYKGRCMLKLSEKTVQKVRNRIRNILFSYKSFSSRLRELSLFIQGWIIQYSSVKLKTITKSFDRFTRQCIRELLRNYGYKRMNNSQIRRLGVASFCESYIRSLILQERGVFAIIKVYHFKGKR